VIGPDEDDEGIGTAAGLLASVPTLDDEAEEAAGGDEPSVSSMATARALLEAVDAKDDRAIARILDMLKE
jgi:hypothetical protein